MVLEGISINSPKTKTMVENFRNLGVGKKVLYKVLGQVLEVILRLNILTKILVCLF